MLMERPVAVPKEMHHQPLAGPSWGPCSTASSTQDTLNRGGVPQLLQDVGHMRCSYHAAAPRTQLTSSATCDLDHTLSEQAASSSAPLRNSSLDSEDTPCPTAGVAPVRVPPPFLRSMSASESTLKEPNVKGERVRGGRGRKVASSCDLEGKVRGGIFRAALYRTSNSLEVPRPVAPVSPDLCRPSSCSGTTAGQRHGGSSAFSCLAQDQPGSQSEAAGSLGSTHSGSVLEAGAGELCPPASPCPSMLGGRFSGEHSRRGREGEGAEGHHSGAGAAAEAGAAADVGVTSPSALSPAGSGGAVGGPAFPTLRWQGPGSAPFLLAAAPLPGKGFTRSSSSSSGSGGEGGALPHAPASSAPSHPANPYDVAQPEEGVMHGCLLPCASSSSASSSSGLGSREGSSGFCRPSASAGQGAACSGSLLTVAEEEGCGGDSDGGPEEGGSQQQQQQQQAHTGFAERAGAHSAEHTVLASQLQRSCSLRAEQGSRGAAGGYTCSPPPMLSVESSGPLGAEWSGACMGAAGQSYGSCGSGLSLLDFADESSNRGAFHSRSFYEPQSPSMYKVRPSGGGDCPVRQSGGGECPPSPHSCMAGLPAQSSHRSSNGTTLSQVPSSLETLGGANLAKVHRCSSLGASNAWPQQTSLGHSYSLPMHPSVCLSPGNSMQLCVQQSNSSFGSLLDYAEACSRSPVRKAFTRGSTDIEAARQSSTEQPLKAGRTSVQ